MTQPSEGSHFPCPECGAPAMAFDAASQQMVCPYCKHTAAVTQTAAAPAQQEHALAEAQVAQVGQPASDAGYGTAVRVVSCQTCGATVNFAGAQISQTCDFCGSQHVLEQDAQRNVIRPESLVAFAVTNDTAKQKFQTWLGSGWFRPGDLASSARSEGLAGVYIPYWTFDTWVDSQWRAEAGHYYYVKEVVVENGTKMQKDVRKTRWEQASGQRRDHHDDVLVVASRGLPEKLANRLATFDTGQLQPYDPSFLAGWRAEEYAVGVDEAWGKAQKRIEDKQRTNCAKDVPGDTQRSLEARHSFSDKTYKHILLPLWISSYRYQDKVYRFLVNGQTGEVSGEAPTSWIKVALFIVLIIAVCAGGMAIMKLVNGE